MPKEPADSPPADLDLTAAGLHEAQQRGLLDLVVEVVETRYRERRKQDRRWWAVMVVTVLTAYVAAGAFYVTMVNEDVSRAEAEAAEANRRLDTPEQELRAPTQTVESGKPIRVEVRRDERARYTIVNVQEGRYVIQAIAISDDFDPLLYLYERIGERIVTVASDDDGGPELNSLIVADLNAGGIYEVAVLEVVGDPGSVELSVQLEE